MSAVVAENAKQIRLSREAADQRDLKRDKQTVDIKVPAAPSFAGRRAAYLRLIAFRNELKGNAATACSKLVEYRVNPYSSQKIPLGDAYVDFEWKEGLNQYIKALHATGSTRYDSLGNIARRAEAVPDRSNMTDVDAFITNDFHPH